LRYFRSITSGSNEIIFLFKSQEFDFGIHVPGEGTSDDLDVPVKEVFCDTTYAEANHLGSLNSIQWGRVVLQTAHYIYVYLKCCSRIGQPVTIVVPTGAAGNGFPTKNISIYIDGKIIKNLTNTLY